MNLLKNQKMYKANIVSTIPVFVYHSAARKTFCVQVPSEIDLDELQEYVLAKVGLPNYVAATMSWQGKMIQTNNGETIEFRLNKATLAYTTLTLEAVPLVGGMDDAFQRAMSSGFKKICKGIEKGASKVDKDPIKYLHRGSTNFADSGNSAINYMRSRIKTIYNKQEE